jgi:hypothetical protein
MEVKFNFRSERCITKMSQILQNATSKIAIDLSSTDMLGMTNLKRHPAL